MQPDPKKIMNMKQVVAFQAVMIISIVFYAAIIVVLKEEYNLKSNVKAIDSDDEQIMNIVREVMLIK